MPMPKTDGPARPLVPIPSWVSTEKQLCMFGGATEGPKASVCWHFNTITPITNPAWVTLPEVKVGMWKAKLLSGLCRLPQALCSALGE